MEFTRSLIKMFTDIVGYTALMGRDEGLRCPIFLQVSDLLERKNVQSGADLVDYMITKVGNAMKHTYLTDTFTSYKM